VLAYRRRRSQTLHDRYEPTTHQVIALLVSARQGDKRSLSEPAVLALQKHWLQLPTTAWSPSQWEVEHFHRPVLSVPSAFPSARQTDCYSIPIGPGPAQFNEFYR